MKRSNDQPAAPLQATEATPRRYCVQVSAGTGPVEVGAFVAQLAAHLEARCRAAGLEVERCDLSGGDADAGPPRSVAIVVRGDAPAVLGAEVGTHALVARSAPRGRASRKRWYAGVALRALAGEAQARAAIDPREIAVTAVRASGPGGQHVNKVATAVRVRHLPSGLEVKVADERSQRANLRRALERLTARLAERDARARLADAADARRAHYRVERGAPVRTYRLGPRGALEPAGVDARRRDAATRDDDHGEPDAP